MCAPLEMWGNTVREVTAEPKSGQGWSFHSGFEIIQRRLPCLLSRGCQHEWHLGKVRLLGLIRDVTLEIECAIIFIFIQPLIAFVPKTTVNVFILAMLSWSRVVL